MAKKGKKGGRGRKAKAWVKRQGLGGMIGGVQDIDVMAGDAIEVTFNDAYTDKGAEAMRRYSGYDLATHQWDFQNAKPTWGGIATRAVDRLISSKTGHYKAMSRGSILANGMEFLNLYEEFAPAVRGNISFREANNCYVASLSGNNPGTNSWSISDPHFFRRMVTVHGVSDVGRFLIQRIPPLQRMASRAKRFFGG